MKLGDDVAEGNTGNWASAHSSIHQVSAVAVVGGAHSDLHSIGQTWLQPTSKPATAPSQERRNPEIHRLVTQALKTLKITHGLSVDPVA